MKKTKKRNYTKRKKIQPKFCIISLTCGRPKYIERSFESLYKRSGVPFDHYVFDDNSDKKTLALLRRLKRKYKFNLFIDTKKLGIFRRLHWGLLKLPLDYKYYVKLDSDVEILTDDFFKHVLDVFKFPEKVSCVIPRFEGLRGAERHYSPIEFFNGHAIKYNVPAVSGCCLIFPENVFNSFPRKTIKEIKKMEDKWGIDSVLCDHAKQFGICLNIEDISVYHIDNTFGQRRVDSEYFTNRKRWGSIDVDVVWYLTASRQYSPGYILKHDLDRLKKESQNIFETFVTCCKESVEGVVSQIKEVEEIKIEKENKNIILKKMYKITSPANFGVDGNIPHGSFKYFAEIPEWAKDNPKLVIELEEIEVEKEIES